MQEIERKYLVNSNAFLNDFSAKHTIKQGYLNSDANRSVRVRIKNDKGFLTIKGKSSENGLSRFEWEKEIDLHEAEKLLLLCEKGVIDKIRYEVKFKSHVIEVDIFSGENEGLIMAEIELKSETETVFKPNWLGLEVTNDNRYYNSYLSKNPFKNW